MLLLLTTIHVIVCLFLILVVLLQQGKGADLSVFGGGSTQAAFGARGAATLLHKLTVGGFIAFILTTTGIGFMRSGGSGSVMSGVEQEVPVEAPAEVPAEGALTDGDGEPLAPEATETMAPAEGDETAPTGDATEGDAPAGGAADGG